MKLHIHCQTSTVRPLDKLCHLTLYGGCNYSTRSLCDGNPPTTGDVTMRLSVYVAPEYIMNSTVTGPFMWRGPLMSSLICAWTNVWVNTGDAGDLRRHRAHYDVAVMPFSKRLGVVKFKKIWHLQLVWNSLLKMLDINNNFLEQEIIFVLSVVYDVHPLSSTYIWTKMEARN